MTNGKFRILLQFQTDFEYSFYISFRLTQSICFPLLLDCILDENCLLSRISQVLCLQTDS